MNVASVDLNLLVALDALLAERSVTRAAARLRITQPAMSHTLTRLRDVFNDPLLVRGRKGAMTPTDRALKLRQPLADALDAVRMVLRGPGEFEPATARRSFVLATADFAAFVLLPSIASILARQAPSIDLHVRQVSVEEAPELLAQGSIDVTLGLPEQIGQSLYMQTLLTERFVCVMRRNHPDCEGKRITLDRWCELPHLLVAPRGTPGGIVDDALAKLGRRRRVALTVPHFLVAPHIVASSDLVWTAPARAAKTYAKMLPLSVREVPIQLDGFSMCQFWHERSHRDPAHTWFRSLIAQAAKASATA